jgi:hypothetical protein
MSNCTLPKCFPVSLPEGINIFENFNPAIEAATRAALAASQQVQQAAENARIEQQKRDDEQKAKDDKKAKDELLAAQAALLAGDNSRRDQISNENKGMMALEGSSKGTPSKNSSSDDGEDDRIKALQDKLDLLILSPKYGSGAPPASSNEKSDSSDKILIYVVVGFLALIIVFLIMNQQK